MEVKMSDRCIHVIDPNSLKCTKCSSPWHIAKNDPRPYRNIMNVKEKLEDESVKYDMNAEDEVI